MYELGAGILPNSICVPLTATARAQALYFYPVLCGHYYCDSQYQVSRPCYENPLLLFVRSGSIVLFIRLYGFMLFYPCFFGAFLS